LDEDFERKVGVARELARQVRCLAFALLRLSASYLHYKTEAKLSTIPPIAKQKPMTRCTNNLDNPKHLSNVGHLQT
jgi:hypothetical protein